MQPPLRRSDIPGRGRHSARPRSRSRRGRRDSLGFSSSRRRWPKRLAITLGVLFCVVVLAVAGVFLYARWRFDQIPKVHIAALTPREANQPFDILLVGSDSRAFVDNSSQAAQFGSAADASGQRSDVDIIARVAPALGEVRLLSIPRDTYVDIPGSVSGVSGPNRINAAFSNGPTLLVQTIEQVFHIPISDYAEVNFPGFQGMVDAVGGIGLAFADPVRDAYSGLDITRTGCQLVNGAQALALVRSRHLYYYSDGAWQEDYASDWSRIQRQDAFFRALLPKLRGLASSPTGLNSFIGAAIKNVKIDSTLSESTLLSLANDFRHLSGSALVSETLPTIPYTTSGGQDVLLPASAPDQQVINQFLAFGTAAHTTAARRGATAPAGGMALLTAAVGNSGVTVTTIAPPSNPSNVVYNTQPEPWNPTPCNP